MEILKYTAPWGRILGIDWDSESLQKFESRMMNDESRERLILSPGNFADLGFLAEAHHFQPIHGVLLDLGVSSWHLEESHRGFSFLGDEPLDMRLAQPPAVGSQLSAAGMLNTFPQKELERILREYGEERFARQIARQIIETRRKKRIVGTKDLVDTVVSAIPKGRFAKIHPATRTFQALRIAVNDELENLRRVLPEALKVLQPGGRIVVISFHSLEDRIVKNFFRDAAKTERLEVLTKKPVGSSLAEVKANPRSRSAKLRAARKIA